MRVAPLRPSAATAGAAPAPTGRRPPLRGGTEPQAPPCSSGRLYREAPAPRGPAGRTATTSGPGGQVVVVDLAAGPAPAQAGLPLGGLGGLVGSGTFAFWTSLTCFVC